ncbi:TPA: TrkA family potassium uptake protein [Vibrio vulnificus]|uniref:potassium channel family protein n=1 Tax=Vibrio vulnificus TaxID=672 RepID=UPI0007EE51EF|nr:TrkA family potassium uptake protein [Vibrio vulnificus]ANN27103.1 Trk system potassium uptake protein TrkA [Vibrio vulnificus]HAS6038913.1 TrkA family potassium uptake protein [Vibrio vulnificus]HAS6058518.1 TrkA family potassium uptake protein [Vibrio vulnificus]HAS6120304.1 TrkA family potassium uptake protein [Vibrio vulnificus]HAS6134454.1 TrkA family potassium uptake protein [Vibrio vulnificus]
MRRAEKQFAVIGLGRFGLAVCQELTDSGAQVLAIDVNEERVKLAAGFVTQALVANCTHEETMAELKLDDYDMVMVAIGADMNSSILATLIAKEAGVKSVWVKANDNFQARVLQKIGADHIIMPERDMGIRVARKMLDKRVLEFHPLGSGLAMTEFVVGSRLMGKTLGELALCKVPGVQVLGFKRGPELVKAPELDVELEIGDMIILVGPQDALANKLSSL